MLIQWQATEKRDARGIHAALAEDAQDWGTKLGRDLAVPVESVVHD
jgi:hypothetical protein